jgi:protein-S-isoprenylcysteine O-methyltransferase Ste14
MAASASTPRIRLTQALFLLVLLTVAFSDRHLFEGLGGLAAQAAGFVLVSTGTLWRIWTSAFIAGRKDAELVEAGPYARCRHPLYFGSLVAGLGLALTTRSLVLTILLPTTIFLVLWRAVQREERFLGDHYGQAWVAYRGRVPAIWPQPGPAAPGAQREVNLHVYRKAFFDAATIFALWLFLVGLDALRPYAAWRAWFPLP